MDKLLRQIGDERAARLARDLRATKDQRKGALTLREYRASLRASELEYLNNKGALMLAFLNQ